MTELLLVGISHRIAPVALRERVAFTERQAARFVTALCIEPAISEAVALSTCNRTELIVVLEDAGSAAESAVLARLAAHAEIAVAELAAVTYTLRNCDAARHLFRVTAGLESMIVGEHEIQGQVKRAHESARETGTSGPLCNRLFGAALHTGRRVRAETAIARSHVSLSSVAVELAERLLGELRGRPVVVIGAGETSELTAQALAARGVATTFIANRHADRARSMAERFGGSVVGLDSLPGALESADIVLASTSSPHPIVGHEELEIVMRARERRPLLLIDIAVPRDIDPLCGDLEGVTLRDIDDLQAAVTHNLSSRTADVPAAEEIIAEEIGRFAQWLGELDVRPTIAMLHARGDQIAEQLLEENAGRWESASSRDLARVEALARAVVARLLHEPTIRLRSLDAERVHGSIELLRDLFALRGAVDDAGRNPAPAREDAHDNVRELRSGNP
ncbi:MAG: glutamyl-tRNA reductase [Acidimicrobiales bacterium]|jgi:glutamyl-tRNA reductase